MSNRLTPIVDQRRIDVAAAKQARPLADIEAGLPSASPVRGFTAALAKPGLQVIAEIKRRSPSMGTLKGDADPAAMAALYERGGAACLSVLTEPHHFNGHLDDLVAARAACRLPVIRKDFAIDFYQLAEARLAGADAALLIVAVLGSATREFLDACRHYGLDALVEVHDEAELEIAIAAGAKLIGVNNRNLTTLEIDLATSERLKPLMPAGVITVSESGLEEPGDFARMADAGYDAVLVGTALMRAGDPAERLKVLLAPTRP
jgi:indole-3-glycerol phosphate synthase